MPRLSFSLWLISRSGFGESDCVCYEVQAALVKESLPKVEVAEQLSGTCMPR